MVMREVEMDDGFYKQSRAVFYKRYYSFLEVEIMDIKMAGRWTGMAVILS